MKIKLGITLVAVGCMSWLGCAHHDKQPDNVYWITGDSKYTDNLGGEYQFGLRTDGIVVWRKVLAP
jgi:hypothetical protein